jgi:hypothetical protein
LNYLKNEGLIFNGYIEDPIRFPPTYKYDPGTNNFDTSSKQRVPSYTDRILYKSQKSSPVTPLYYDSVRDVVTSGTNKDEAFCYRKKFVKLLFLIQVS